MSPDAADNTEARFFEALKTLAARMEEHGRTSKWKERRDLFISGDWKPWFQPLLDLHESGQWQTTSPAEKKEKVDHYAFGIRRSDITFALSHCGDYVTRQWERDFWTSVEEYERLLDAFSGPADTGGSPNPRIEADAAKPSEGDASDDE